MSKSYGRYKTIGFCTGSNTEYYKSMRRLRRSKMRHALRNFYANGGVEAIEEKYSDPNNKLFRDTWEEPTDGHYRVYTDNPRFDRFRGLYRYGKKVKK